MTSIFRTFFYLIIFLASAVDSNAPHCVYEVCVVCHDFWVTVSVINALIQITG